MQTIRRNSLENTAKEIDKKIMKIGKDLLFKTRFGVGNNNINLNLYKELSILKEAMCLDTCINKGAIMEAISKKINSN